MARHQRRGAGNRKSEMLLARVAHPVIRHAFIENLESRQLMASVALASGVLTLNGDTTAINSLKVELNSSGQVIAKYNDSSKTFSKSAVKSVVLRGGTKNDYLSVTSSLSIPTKIYGQAGNDTVWGGNGTDVVYGGPGNDQLNGRSGNDELHGEDGNDTIDGGAGTDKYSGGNGTNSYKAAETKIASPSSGSSTGSSGSGSPTTPTTPTTPTAPGEPTLPGNGSTGTPDAVISAQVNTITAGNAVHVQGLTSTLNGGTPLTARYEWDFGDSSGKYNKLVGFNAAHIYNTPGTYTITFRLTNEGGKSDTATKQISVTSDNRRTIYVSGSGSDGNNGSSQGSAIKTIGRLKSLLGGSDNVKVLFERGDQFTLADNLSITGDNIYFGAYGSGSLPQIYWTGARSFTPMFYASGSNVVFSDLSFNTKFTDTEKANMPDALGIAGKNIAVRGVEFLNVGNGVNANSNPTGVLVQDSTAPSVVGLRSYFAWVEGNDQVYLGNRVANSTREAPFRVSDNAQRVLLYANDFTNLSRVSAGDRLDTSKNSLTVQWGSYIYITGNKFSKGPVRVGPLGDGDGFGMYNARFNYAVIESNRFDAPNFVLHGLSHAMYRNNISTASGYAAYTVEGYSSDYNRGVVDVSFVNNTVINGATDGQFLKVQGDASGLSLVNNLYSAPNLQSGDGGTVSVYVQDSNLASFKVITNNVWTQGNPQPWTNGGLNYINTSIWDENGFQTPTEWNSLAQVGTDLFSDTVVDGRFAPSASSLAANAGRLYGGVFVDYYGKIRPSTGAWSAGAVEV